MVGGPAVCQQSFVELDQSITHWRTLTGNTCSRILKCLCFDVAGTTYKALISDRLPGGPFRDYKGSTITAWRQTDNYLFLFNINSPHYSMYMHAHHT